MNEEKIEQKEEQVIQTQVPVAATPPSNYDDVYKLIQEEIAKTSPKSPDELAKEQRRERTNGIIAGIGDAVSALSNLYFTTQGSPNAYDPTQGLSAKSIARRDKLKAEREKDADRRMNLMLTLGKLKDQDRDYQMKQRQFDEGVRQFNTNINLHQQQLAEREKERQENAERWQKQFEEGVRQFDVNSERQAQQLKLQGRQYARQMEQGSMTFNLGSGYGNVKLTQDQLNATNVSRIFNSLPEEVKAKLQKPVLQKTEYGYIIAKDEHKNTIYEPISTEAMLIAIGAHLENSQSDETKATREAILQVAGKKKGEPKTTSTTMPGVGGGGTMPGVK